MKTVMDMGVVKKTLYLAKVFVPVILDLRMMEPTSVGNVKTQCSSTQTVKSETG